MSVWLSVAELYNYISPTVVANLTDDTNGTVIDVSIVQFAIDSAESVARSYLQLNQVVEATYAVKYAVAALAKQILLARKNRGQESTVEYNDAKVWLKEVMQGMHQQGSVNDTQRQYYNNTDYDEESDDPFYAGNLYGFGISIP